MSQHGCCSDRDTRRSGALRLPLRVARRRIPFRQQARPPEVRSHPRRDHRAHPQVGPESHMGAQGHQVRFPSRPFYESSAACIDEKKDTVSAHIFGTPKVSKLLSVGSWIPVFKRCVGGDVHNMPFSFVNAKCFSVRNRACMAPTSRHIVSSGSC